MTATSAKVHHFAMHPLAPQGGKANQSNPQNTSSKMLANVLAELSTWLTYGELVEVVLPQKKKNLQGFLFMSLVSNY